MSAHPPLTISEANFQRLVIRQAQVLGWHVAHFLPGRRGTSFATHMEGHPGFPDLVLARDGVVLVRELKKHGGRTSPAQRDWLGHLGSHGSVWAPTDWRRILSELHGEVAA